MVTKTSLPVVFIAPTIVLLAILALVPTVYAIFISLENITLSQPDGHFVWLHNFALLMSDDRFLHAAWVSVEWEIITVCATMAVAILLAVLLFHAASPATRNTLALVFIAPVLLPRVSAAFVWKFAFHPLFGIFTYPYKVLMGHPVDLFAGAHSALATVAAVDVWQWGLFFSVIIMKLLETLPKAPFEAAEIDHAMPWEIYLYVALPMLRGPLISLVFVKMVESLRSFDLIYVMTRGGPGIATETLDMYAFSQGFIELGNISYACSMAVLMMLVTNIVFAVMWKKVRA